MSLRRRIIIKRSGKRLTCAGFEEDKNKIIIIGACYYFSSGLDIEEEKRRQRFKLVTLLADLFRSVNNILSLWI